MWGGNVRWTTSIASLRWVYHFWSCLFFFSLTTLMPVITGFLHILKIEFVSSSGYSSDPHFICCGVPQGSILGLLLLLLIYINYLHHTTKHWIHDPSNDSNLLYFSHSIKKMNKQVNYDLKNLNNWLSTSKICVNVSKTEVLLFKSLIKQTDSP